MTTATHDPADLLRRARVMVHIGPEHTTIRLSSSSPFMTFVASLIVLGLTAGVVYLFASVFANSNQVPVPWVIAGSAAVVAASLALAMRRRLINESGSQDLVIDRVTNQVTLPRTFGRAESLMLPLAQLTAILPAQEFARGEIPGLRDEALGPKEYKPLKLALDEPVRYFGSRQNACFAVVVLWRDGDGLERLDPIIRWYDHPRADALAHWLNLQCGLDPRLIAAPIVG